MQLVFVHPGMGVEEYFSASFGYMDSRPDQKAGVVSTHTGKWREGAMLLEKATALLGRPPRRALDCGLGMGGAAIALARSGTAVVGLDYSLWYLEMARVHAFLLSTPLSALRADAQSMCFRDGAFDLVLLLDILEHVPRPDLMFREIARVLSPDGVLIFRNQYALRPDVLRRDPHYGVPLVVLLPRFLRRWIVVDRLKRAPELEDFKWFKTFGGLRRFARRNGIEVAPLDPSLTRDFRAAARGAPLGADFNPQTAFPLRESCESDTLL
jgi:SAM-dependent methyltransferase